MAYVSVRARADGSPSWRVGWRVDGRQVWTPPIESEELAESVRELVESAGPDVALRTLDEIQGRAVAERQERTIAARAAFIETHLGVTLTPWQREVIGREWPT